MKKCFVVFVSQLFTVRGLQSVAELPLMRTSSQTFDSSAQKDAKKVKYVKKSEMKNKLTGDFGLFRKTFFDLFRGYL